MFDIVSLLAKSWVRIEELCDYCYTEESLLEIVELSLTARNTLLNWLASGANRNPDEFEYWNEEGHFVIGYFDNRRFEAEETLADLALHNV